MVEEGDPGLGNPTDFFIVTYQTMVAGGLVQHLDEWENEMDPGLVHMVRRGMEYSAVEYVQARIERLAFCDRLARFFERYDFLLTPATAVTAFAGRPGGAGPGAVRGGGPLRVDPLQLPVQRDRQPGRERPVRLHRRTALPIGLQIVGRMHEDQAVLQAAAAFERIAPWADRRPPAIPA